MDCNTFLDTITRRAPVPPEKAEPLTRATLETPANRFTRGVRRRTPRPNCPSR